MKTNKVIRITMYKNRTADILLDNGHEYRVALLDSLAFPEYTPVYEHSNGSISPVRDGRITVTFPTISVKKPRSVKSRGMEDAVTIISLDGHFNRVTPDAYKQYLKEKRELEAEHEMAWDLAMNDHGSALRRNEQNIGRFKEKWFGVMSKSQKTLDSFKRKMARIKKVSKKKVKRK